MYKANPFVLVYDSILQLLFPRTCFACGEQLLQHEHEICTSCLYDLPRTNFHQQFDNPVARLFWGRTRFESACAFFYFHKGGKVQKLIHQLKYKGQKEIGFELGRQFGYELINSPLFADIDVIIPVPLHPEKEALRGYNQSKFIADGISSVLQKPVDDQSLVRTIKNSTQTKKSRYERWENVDKIFTIRKDNMLKNKHILLVDDVVTTGSTLEACANKVLEINGAKISMATLAVA